MSTMQLGASVPHDHALGISWQTQLVAAESDRSILWISESTSLSAQRLGENCMAASAIVCTPGLKGTPLAV
jgi:hypothetical protein